ncbi:MAG: TetR family transcriptional regulator [Caulobacterales bacterium 32-69-10]|nr:MAG: TetR family transcriptional regulator [Caulobacterales bacterium 32-69-10]
MPDKAADAPRWRRRKTARPAEIVAAAMDVFAEKGFAAARLEDVAARAGVSKAALYLYFETKTDLFRAVVNEAVSPRLDQARMLAAVDGQPLATTVPALLGLIAGVAQGTRIGAVAKMVIGESRNFPDLAQVWHDQLVSQALGILTALIARAQARGEAREGDPRLYAVSLMGPMLAGILWREVFEPVGAAPIDLSALAAQQAQTFLQGVILKEAA